MRIRRNHFARQRRTGSIYLITIGAALLVSLFGMAAFLKIQIRRSQFDETVAVFQARNCARSAAAMALFLAQTDPDWRSKMANDTWATDEPLGTGSLSFRASDADGSLTDSIHDPVRITATGTSGPARQVLQVTLQPKRIGPDCIQVALHVGGSLLFSNMRFSCGQTISASDIVSAVDSVVACDVESSARIIGATYTKSVTPSAPPRSLPASDVMDYYLNSGTRIDYTSLPNGSTINQRIISAQLLSPKQNPWGVPNAKGIYYIDCDGKQLAIQDSRIVATLVLLNVGNLDIKNSVSWETPRPNYPALLVSGNAQLHIAASSLREDDVQLNFNPPATPYPYPFGGSNTNSEDQYPSRLRGLIYVTGQLSMYGNTSVTGAIVCGGNCVCADPLDGSASVSLIYDPSYANNPPPGFEGSVSVSLQPGTWMWAVD